MLARARGKFGAADLAAGVLDPRLLLGHEQQELAQQPVRGHADVKARPALVVWRRQHGAILNKPHAQLLGAVDVRIVQGRVALGVLGVEVALQLGKHGLQNLQRRWLWIHRQHVQRRLALQAEGRVMVEAEAMREEERGSAAASIPSVLPCLLTLKLTTLTSTLPCSISRTAASRCPVRQAE